MSLVQVVVWIGMAGALWFLAMSVYGVWDFCAHRRREDVPSEGWAPPVTILKPLKGLDAHLYENLRSFCQQDYPSFELVFGVADADDPAIAIVRRLCRDFPHLGIALEINGRLHGTNHKVSNLVNAYAKARHGVIVVADSDIRVPRDYLRRVVAPLRDETIGLVTCPYRAVVARHNLATVFEALFLNTDFLHQIMVARKIEKPSYAFGASMVIRRATLEAVGGFVGLADLLADDYHLGHRVAGSGQRVWLSDCMVETVLAVDSWKHWYRHQMRRARNDRSSRPGGYFGTIVTHATLWAMANLLTAGAAGVPLMLSGLVLGARALSAAYISRRFLKTNLGLLDLLLVFPKDLCLSGVWVASFLGNTVWWRGRRFRVLKSGRMELIGTDGDVEAVDITVRQAS